MNKSRHAILLFLAGAAFSAIAEDYQDGTPSVERCVAKLKHLDAELDRLHDLEEKRLAVAFALGTPGIEDGYAEQAITACKFEVATWRKYRVSKCCSEPFRSGMNLQYAGSVTAACEAGEAQARAKELRKWFKR